MNRSVTVCRKEHFNAAHRLHNTALSDEENREVFGKCNNANYHGHNYELITELTGEIDPSTGYVYDLKLLSDLIKVKVLDRFDHKNLNLDTEEFKEMNPTAENISVVIYNILRRELPGTVELRITLYETDRNYVKYPADKF